MQLTMARLDWAVEKIRIRLIHVEKRLLTRQFGVRRFLRDNQKRDVLLRGPIEKDHEGIHTLPRKLPHLV